MDFQKLAQELKKMQNTLSKKQKEFEEKVFDFDYKGYVLVKIKGDLNIEAIEIKTEIVDPEDKETLQDILRAAINEAISTTCKERDAIMNATIPKGTGLF
ncbi:YbaB/EbfC family nucleoid-associated protein [Ureaplasma parvum]|uniref:Nucleoid-associated protein CEG42_00935 n=1 Tax=Ureaplasma parvum TaxID=134821 RepID=A0AAC9X6R6_UREPR|nr:YbaB/EbfC family nucleoid-associated protein [Ureaplasma parvum]ASD24555.1 YbaB/EbfC family nucleoid-associated protein [Ureaplasma parvum]ASD25166.1 YbaB/EbfC family nucleoid-associated protein [Ureaplasma parvum]ASD28902.1 YbaB/EbfC family nucleoid-associated protein [Ureaplasma parvum]ASD29415.1 YbaB/EbfC family nucleoid-associated protein [Ureaplasma parvum]ASD29808.1 YbaB/EbfC family nucleoid-associated protein [Ureaplasma parvum]